MTNEKSSLGWSNYATMTIALWIDNDSKNNDYKKALIATSLKYSQEYAERLNYLSEAIESWIESTNPMPEDDISAFGNLVHDSLTRVCWYEIAEKWLKD